MIKSLMAVAIVFAMSTGAANADIPRPPRVNYDTHQVSALGSQGLYNVLDVRAQWGDSLRTMVSVYKVLRAQDGLSEVVCYKSTRAKRNTTPAKVSYSCKINTSKDGREVPKHKHRRRLG